MALETPRTRLQTEAALLQWGTNGFAASAIEGRCGPGQGEEGTAQVRVPVCACM